MSDRDNLIKALEQPGAGTLVHPYRGSISVVVVDPGEVREDTREGGMARFRISFAESGEKLEPSTTSDTAAQAQAQATSTNSTLVHSFSSKFSLAGMPSWVSDAATGQLGGLTSLMNNLRDSIPGIPSSVTSFDNQLAGFSDALSSLIRTPFDLGVSIVSMVLGLGTIAQQPIDALGLYTNLLGFGNDDAPIVASTPNRQQQASNQAAINALVQGIAAAQAVAAASSVPAQSETVVQMVAPIVNADGTTSLPPGAVAIGPASPAANGSEPILVPASVTIEGYATIDAATSVRDKLADAIDDQSLNADDDAYAQLQDLRVALINDINTRAASLPSMTTFTPLRTLPTLVIAYRLYADATRDAEIVDRNDLVYPGFATGGVALEVLGD
jgi:prophage DNA circulation protein